MLIGFYRVSVDIASTEYFVHVSVRPSVRYTRRNRLIEFMSTDIRHQEKINNDTKQQQTCLPDLSV